MKILDTIGKVCPFPLEMAKEYIKTLEKGEEFVIKFDCTQGTESLPQWASESGHEILDFTQESDAVWSLKIKK